MDRRLARFLFKFVIGAKDTRLTVSNQSSVTTFTTRAATKKQEAIYRPLLDKPLRDPQNHRHIEYFAHAAFYDRNQPSHRSY